MDKKVINIVEEFGNFEFDQLCYRVEQLVDDDCRSEAFAEIAKFYELKELEEIFNNYAIKMFLTVEDVEERDKYVKELFAKVAELTNEEKSKYLYTLV